MTAQADDPTVTLIREAIRFLDWAAGEGITPVDGQPAGDPEEILMAYSQATGDEDWEGLADRIAASVEVARRER